MNILIIGQGGREHALAWKAASSPQTSSVWVAPGNAGTALEPKVSNVDIAVTAVNELVDFAKEKSIDLTIIGPEAALAAGVVDAFQAAKLPCFGPTQQAARLEISKAFCKDFLQQHHIPTARYACFSEVEPALNYLLQQSFPIVIKADGLAAGKGVIIAEHFSQAEETVRDMLSGNAFGIAGSQIVIEEFLTGYEISYIAMVDGQHILPLASSIDHKRLLDNDLGPNTGGMGAISPAPQLTNELEQLILQDIMYPTVNAMRAMGTPYTGFLYAGLMIDESGIPKVLEFNCRLGDPEAQAILMRLQTDLIDLCKIALAGRLNQVTALWDPRAAITVVMTAGGYPFNINKGDIIEGLFSQNEAHSKVFHAATKQSQNHIVTDGGRVLGVSALGNTIAAAQTTVYDQASKITWPNCFYRHDIGAKYN